MKKQTLKITALITLCFTFFYSCKKNSDDAVTPEISVPTNKTLPLASEKLTTSCNDINLFGVSKDRDFGKQAYDYFSNPDSSGNIILDSAQYSTAYAYLYSIRNELFSKNNIDNAGEFEWKMRIIKDDTTLNAFCTPGGYIFVYTGIIKYLENEDDFAGVLGHEIGHAALRHSTQTMTKQYGTSIFLQLLGYDKSVLVNAIRNLGSLSYSRCHESQADEYSVILLANTKYKCNGAASFFEKIVASGGSSTPAFLSTHPDPGDRVTNINKKADELKCNKTIPAPVSGWAQFKTDLKLN